MLIKLATWYLRKRNRSVLIGYEVKGGYLRSLNNDSIIYDNVLKNVDYRQNDGKPFLIPEGKFSTHEKNVRY